MTQASKSSECKAKVKRQRRFNGYDQRIQFSPVLNDSVFSENYERLQLLTQMKQNNITSKKY